MYQVFKNKRLVKALNYKQEAYSTYEEARQALRKYIRMLVNKGKASAKDFGAYAFDGTSRGPVNYTNFGFTIRQVA
jgi:hypothetical protein